MNAARLGVAAATIAIVLSSSARASDVEIVGNVSVTPNFAATYVTVAADRVENFDFFGSSGTLRLENWAFGYPFTGSYQSGYMMAVATLGQLSGGYYLYGISHYVPLNLPPYGYYCPSLVLTEYTLLSGYVARDWVNFSCRYLGTPPVFDFDLDGWIDPLDNCVLTWNPSQANADADAFGDACDACTYDAANDSDGDGRCANVDNCPVVANANQTNSDGDSSGDSCDACPYDGANDGDGDGRCANQDNCSALYNPNQLDSDGDGLGDVCDPTPNPEPAALLLGLAAIAALIAMARGSGIVRPRSIP